MATTAPILGKWVDNGRHGYNLLLRQPLTPAQLDKVLSLLSLMSRGAGTKYDIDDYNCTDFALAAFNLARTDDPGLPPRIHIPNTPGLNGSMTPQGVYRVVREGFKKGGYKGAVTTINTQKVYAGKSSLPRP